MSGDIFDFNMSYEELKRYIYRSQGSFAVKNDANEILITFGRFKYEYIACAAVKLLIKYDWNILQVNEDPIIEYENEFFVFKVMNNSLIFDSKFDSFESAVEYYEINYRCNDYHNDIFKNSSKRNGYKERWSFSDKREEEVIDERYIFEKSGKFLVKRSKQKGNFVFGKFDSFEVAKAARKVLLDYNWKLPDDNFQISFF